MAEAFIMGGGGGATIQHITATDTKSNTFTLTNPKRTNCLVFGRIRSVQEHFQASSGIRQHTFTREHLLYGSKYAVNHNTYNYSNYSDTNEFTSELAITFTRNASSIAITLNSSYPFVAATSYDYSSGEFPEMKRTNTIDIYVVDYD